MALFPPEGGTGKMEHRVIKGVVLCAVLFVSSIAWGAHPLITDDTETLGKGKFQVEVSGEYGSKKETLDGVSVEETGAEVATTLSYGFIESADLVLSLPHHWGQVKEDGVTVYDEKGISDMIIEIKWRFFKNDGLSLALKPGLIFPTGNKGKGLGSGKTGYQLFLIGSKEVAPWAFHANIGYIGNENEVNERTNIWHASLAATCEVVKDLKLVGNIGIERNRAATAVKDPAFLIGGVIYSLSERFDIDFGVKSGLTPNETEWSLMAGMAFRF